MVYITGDIHGELEPIYMLFERFQPKPEDIIVILGDVALNYTGRLRDRAFKELLRESKHSKRHSVLLGEPNPFDTIYKAKGAGCYSCFL